MDTAIVVFARDLRLPSIEKVVRLPAKESDWSRSCRYGHFLPT